MTPSKTVKSVDTFVMVVDVGTLFIKYSLFANYKGMNEYILKTEIKYMNDIFQGGTVNYNLFSRDLNRKVDEFRQLGEIDMLILIPQRSTNISVCLPRFEYQDNPKEFKTNIKTEYKKLDNNVNVYDWTKLSDNPDKDYQSVLIDSVPEDIVMSLNEIAVGLHVKEFLVTSPMLGYLNIFEHDGKAHAVVDVGHNQTRISIVKDGIPYLLRDRPKAGDDITNVLTSHYNSTYEAMIRKHNTDISSLHMDVNNTLYEIRDAIKISCEEYANIYNDVVKDFCIIGGTASIELEEEINKQTIGIDRVYPRMQLDNDAILPMETRHYFFNSYSMFRYYMDNNFDKEKLIDFSASKSGGLGLKVKTLSRTYNKFKGPLVAGVTTLYLLAGTVGFFSHNMFDYKQSVMELKDEYEGKLTETTTAYDSTYATFQSLNAETLSQQGSNTGLLLSKIKDISPTNINIKTMKFEGSGDKGTIVIKSDSQVSIATFLTLLKAPSNGIFQKANIAEIEVMESADKSFYETTIDVEGRKL